MKPSKLKQYGEHMFGPAWQKGFAENFGKCRSTIRSWYSERQYYKMPDDIKEKVLSLLKAHGKKTDKFIKELEND